MSPHVEALVITARQAAIWHAARKPRRAGRALVFARQCDAYEAALKALEPGTEMHDRTYHLACYAAQRGLAWSAIMLGQVEDAIFHRRLSNSYRAQALHTEKSR